MYHNWPFSQDLWSLYHKVTFDGENSLIIINDNETDINIEIDIYSDWKEWALLRDHLKFYPALRTVGGDPTTAGNRLGATFFTINNWQIQIDDNVNFVGNIFSDDFSSPFTTLEGTKLAQAQVSNLIDKIALSTSDLVAGGIATSGDITNQTTTIQTDITNQTTVLQTDISGVQSSVNSIPSGVVNGLNSTNYDGVAYSDIIEILLSMAQGRIVESSSGVFDFYAQDNSTVLYSLTKSGNQRVRS